MPASPVAKRRLEGDISPVRYEMRKLANGWSVWDNTTNAPAVVEGCWQTCLSLESADDLTDVLNRLERAKAARADH